MAVLIDASILIEYERRRLDLDRFWHSDSRNPHAGLQPARQEMKMAPE